MDGRCPNLQKNLQEKFNADTGTTHFPDQGLNYSSDFTTPIQFELKMRWEMGAYGSDSNRQRAVFYLRWQA